MRTSGEARNRPEGRDAEAAGRDRGAVATGEGARRPAVRGTAQGVYR